MTRKRRRDRPLAPYLVRTVGVPIGARRGRALWGVRSCIRLIVQWPRDPRGLERPHDPDGYTPTERGARGVPSPSPPRATFSTAAAIAASTVSADGVGSSKGAVASLAAISRGLMAAGPGIAADGMSRETARAQAAHPEINRKDGICRSSRLRRSDGACQVECDGKNLPSSHGCSMSASRREWGEMGPRWRSVAGICLAPAEC